MPSLPSARDVHVNVPLTNISIAYLQSATDFVANRVFASVPSTHQGNRYYEYPRGDWFRSEARVRAPGAESAGGGWNLTNTSTYFCDVVSVHKDVADQIRANTDPVINLDRDAALWVAQQMMIKRDADWAAEFFVTGQWGTDVDVSAGTEWNQANSTPIEDIRTQIYAMKSSTGMKPNVLVLGANVWAALQDNDDFITRIQFGTPSAPALVTPNLLAQTLELDEVVIASGVQNTAIEGATDSNDFILGDNALLAYRNPNPSPLTPSAGYVFEWTGLLPGSGNLAVSNFRMEHLKSDRIEAEMAYDMKLVAADLGTLFYNTLA